MLYKVSVFKLTNRMKKWEYSIELPADTPMDAIEHADVAFRTDRIIEIQAIEPFNRPQVNRVNRDGLL